MRHFEQIVLVSEDGKKTIIERRYSTGEVEYWSLMSIAFRNQQHQGNAQVPFRIEIAGVVNVPDDEFLANPQAAALRRTREAAFDAFDAALEAAKPSAHESVKQQVEQATRREHSKILLAGAMPHIPVQ